MKRIMIAALAVLMTLTLSVGAMLPAFAEAAHDHDVEAVIDERANVGATATEKQGPDLQSHKPTLFFPLNAQPIDNIADFLAMQTGGVYYLTTDLVMPMTHPGITDVTLYGAGHTITTNVPIFAMIDNVEIHDITIEGEIKADGNVGALSKEAYLPRLVGVVNNANVTSTTNGYTGGLIGFVLHRKGEVSMRYCVNNGRIDNASAASGKTDAGGLIGIVRGPTTGEKKNGTWQQLVDKNDILTIEHCVNNGEVYGSNRTGGIVGVMGEAAWILGTTRVINCANYGNVTSTQHYVGGFTARISSIEVLFENCINTGDVLTLTNEKYGGGIVGLSEDPGVKLVFRNCRNEGEVTTTNFVGGILGKASKWGQYYATGTTVENDTANIPASSFYFYDCVNTGDATATKNAGGFGLIESAATLVVERCENHGTINGKDNAAGLFLQVGATTSTFEDCYNSGDVTASDAGGMVGELTWNNSKISFRNCVNDGNITGGRPGGILGVNDGKTIKGQIIDCVNNGKILSTSNYAGGIASRFDARVVKGSVTGFESQMAILFLRCVNNGEVESFQSQVGGMVGYLDGTFNENGNKDKDGKEIIDANEIYTAEFRECINTGYIHSTDLTKSVTAGGLLGNVDAVASVYNCVNTGKIHTGGTAGGITGQNGRHGTYVSCVNMGDIFGGACVGGIGGNIGGQHQPGSGNLFDKCVTIGQVTGSGIKVGTGRTNTTAGLSGYVWGAGTAQYCAVMSNVSATYPQVQTGFQMFLAGALFGYQNSNGGYAQNNYFGGTLTVTNGSPVFYKGCVDSSCASASANYKNNFSTTSMPIYYDKTNNAYTPSTMIPTAITAAEVSTDAFVNTLNTAAGADAFVMVTTCEGESFPIHKDTVATFNVARSLHNDPSYNYYTKLASNANAHWYECPTCGVRDNATVAAHTGGTATCKAAAVCTVCSTSYGEVDPYNHVDNVTWTTTATTHSATLSCCGTIEAEAHTFVNGVCVECDYTCLHDHAHENSKAASCCEAAYCGLCEMSYGEADPTKHVFDTAWSFDAETEHHYRACTNPDCDAITDEGACAGGVAKCNTYARCATCNNQYGEFDPDNHVRSTTEYQVNELDASKHDLIHTCCGAVIETTEHTAEGHVDATCCSRAVCKDCGAYGDFDPNNHQGEPTDYIRDPADPNKHIVVWGDCCEMQGRGDHVGGEASCKDAAVCEICGMTYGVADGDHVYHGACDSKCNVCGLDRDSGDHTFGDWTVTKEATETEFGSKERTCTVCGKTQKASISIITNADSALNGITDQGGQANYSWLGVIVIVGAAAVVIGVVVVFIVSKKKKAK